MKNNNTTTTAGPDAVISYEYVSLYDFRGRGTKRDTTDVAKQVYEEAKRRGITVGSREIETLTYVGSVMTYPKWFLEQYFNSPQNDEISYEKGWFTQDEKNEDVKPTKSRIPDPSVLEILHTMWWAKVNRVVPMEAVINVLHKLGLHTDAWSIAEDGYIFYSKDGKTKYQHKIEINL